MIWPLFRFWGKFFVGFLENLKKSKRHSEINWPLAVFLTKTKTKDWLSVIWWENSNLLYVQTIYKSVSSNRPPLLENLPLNTGRLFITTCIHHSYLLLSLKLRPQRIAYQLRYSNPILQSTSPHFTIITKNIQKVSLLSKQQKLLRLQQKNPSQKVSSSPTSYLTDITKMAGRKKMWKIQGIFPYQIF